MQVDKAKFEKGNAGIFGVNNNNVQAHQSYCEKFGFSFPILSDGDLQVSKAYGAEKDGRVKRTVVVIGPDGKIKFHRYGMPTDDEILAALA